MQKINLKIISLLFVLITLSVVFLHRRNMESSIQVFTNPNPNENIYVWYDSSSNPSYVQFPLCWKQFMHAYPGMLLNERDYLEVQASDRCSQSELGGEWTIMFVPRDQGTNSAIRNWKPPLRSGHKQIISVKNMSVEFFDRVDRYNSHLENPRTPKAMIFWTAIFDCGSQKSLSSIYQMPLNDEAEIEKLSSAHIVPEVFKKFISGFECKK